MKLWLLEMDFSDGRGRLFEIRYHIYMTDDQARQLAATLESSRISKPPYRKDDLMSFDIEPVDTLTFSFEEFIEDVRENHPVLLRKLKKRWGSHEP